MFKRSVRVAMQVIQWIVVAAFAVVLSPVLIVAALLGLWRRIELWAFYENDEEKRRKAEWKD